MQPSPGDEERNNMSNEKRSLPALPSNADRAVHRSDVVDGMFVLISVNGLDDVIDFDSSFHGSMIQLEVTES
jgi:hypothetical protein